MIVRLMPTLRARLMGMLLASAIPLFAMAAFIAWQSYREVVLQSQEDLSLARVDAVGRAASMLSDTEGRLRGLASLPAVRSGTAAQCDALLEQVLLVERASYEWFQVLDRSGAPRCQAGNPTSRPRPTPVPLTPVAGSGGVAAGFGDAVFSVGDPYVGRAPDASTPGATLLPLALRLVGTDGLSGAILTAMSLDELAHRAQHGATELHTSTWIVDSANRVIRLGGAGPGALQPPALDRLAGSQNRPIRLLGSNGQSAQFVLASVTTELRLLVGLPTTAHLDEARGHLARQLVVLGLLLVAGVLAMAVGANAIVVRPLRQLSGAVARWRDGGKFLPGYLKGAPREVADLSQSFSRAVTALDEREVQLREAATQQELLMQEIHHRVKNNLQIVASLLSLQGSRIKLPEAKAEFQAAGDRIRALATLHRHLYAHGELHTINMRSFLNELCEQLLAAIGETPAGGRIKLEIAAPELRISSDQAVPMALIVTEAVSNAAKYAFPGGRSGHISVRLQIDGEGGETETLRLTIEDDGVGIPSGRADTETGVRDGIGTQLIQGFARQLKATVRLTQDRGTCYELEIPLHRDDRSSRPEALV